MVSMWIEPPCRRTKIFKTVFRHGLILWTDIDWGPVPILDVCSHHLDSCIFRRVFWHLDCVSDWIYACCCQSISLPQVAGNSGGGEESWYTVQTKENSIYCSYPNHSQTSVLTINSSFLRGFLFSLVPLCFPSFCSFWATYSH